MKQLAKAVAYTRCSINSGVTRCCTVPSTKMIYSGPPEQEAPLSLSLGHYQALGLLAGRADGARQKSRQVCCHSCPDRLGTSGGLLAGGVGGCRVLEERLFPLLTNQGREGTSSS